MNHPVYHLIQKGKQSGPFSGELITQMMDSGQVAPTDLVWCQGMVDWQPAGQHFGTSVVPPPLPQATGGTATKGSSGLGWTSLGIGLFMFVAWFVLLVVAGLAHEKGEPDNSPVYMVVGLLSFAGMGLNVMGIVFGIIPLFGEGVGKTVPIVGGILNGIELVGMVLIIMIGMAMG
ncbi:MAG: DUF4339 domain-containing protein [Verrucomicrobiae bacterium]|nr:DUF4339 domain-containing protein [Verrucomicrobiae bacterium]